jgi:alkanesulfonate monooxygenase SsuD/methylene tetrahydromethanopterin reductase-like flavin-dependent oxidoreductase (luciferase family)
MPRIAIRYDLRAPSWGPATATELHQAFVDQVRWADERGFDAVILSEHHGAEDGFMSAPLTLAAVVAAVTEHVNISISAALVTLHDPVRFAEQLTTIDQLAPGRLLVILGTGYRQAEFDMMGLDFKDRWQVFDENVGVIRAALTGQPFEYQGRQVVVTPAATSPQSPLLTMGGSSEAAARRAARLGLGFFAASADSELSGFYEDECRKVGFEYGFSSVPGRLGFVHVSNDPDADWERIGPHALHEAQTYGSWQRPGQHSAVTVDDPTSIDSLKASGVYRVLTPDQCVELWNEMGDEDTFILHPLMGGIPPKLAWESLHLFEAEVLPRVRS